MVDDGDDGVVWTWFSWAEDGSSVDGMSVVLNDLSFEFELSSMTSNVVQSGEEDCDG